MTKIAKDMFEPTATLFDAGDFCWSARTSKTGWLLCQGQAVSRSTYAALFSAIGTAYGTGDGSTTFNLPDGQGRVMLGAGSGSGLTARARGDKGGAETHTLASGEMPSHRHRLSGNNASGGNVVTGLADAGSRTVAGNTNASNITYIDTNNAVALVENTGGGGAHNNMQPWVAANLFIYTGV